MDDLLSEFLTETAENLEVIDSELVKFESDPNDRSILDNIFRLVHTIKGTCGFLGLPRLEAVAHASETLLGRFRDGELEVTGAAVSIVLRSIDRIKELLAHLEAEQAEPAGDDGALIAELEAAAEGPAPAAEPEPAATSASEESADGFDADLGRALRPGEVSLADLEAAFHSVDGPDLDQLAADADRAREQAPAAAPAGAGGPTEEADKSRESTIASQSIRVNVDVLENLMTMVSELVLTRNQLLQMVRGREDSEFKAPLQRLSNITAELQDGVMQTRMQPIGNAWKKLPRIVRDCTREVGKKIELVMEGQDTELDRQVLDLIKDPLTHMVRNSCDHGVESPEDRAMTGKPETGVLRLRAFHEGGHIIIEVSDDGAGLNTAKIKRKAIDKGLVSEAEAELLSDNQIHKFIFDAGFSTAAQVTNLSGRGVGMDVVRTNIEQIGGAIELNSVEGRGTTFTIKIPLTLAIISALIVRTRGSAFAIPQLAIVELVRVGGASDSKVEQIKDTRVLRLRDRLLPLVDLAGVLQIDDAPAPSDTSFVVVMQVGAQRFGLVVDEVFDTEEIVVKPLASVLRHVPVFSGNTILGDGSVTMIIDPNGVAQRVGRAPEEVERSHEEDLRRRADQRDTTSMLLFRAGSSDPKAVPLSLVTRLEAVDAGSIERANDQLVVQYRNSLTPLVQMGALADEGKQPMLVFTDQGRTVGVLVDEIVDIVEEHVRVEIEGDRPGVVGAAVLRERATEIVDVGYYLTQAYPDWFERADVIEETAPRRILLVDDSSFFRNMMEPLLKAAGYEVTAVDGPEEAWELNRRGAEFDAIVTDIEMPGANGYEFAEQLRNDDRWAHIPRLALSAQDAGASADAAPDAFVDFVPKKDRSSIVAAISYALAHEGEAA